MPTRGSQRPFNVAYPSKKSFTISRAMLKSRQALLAELAKCDVLCANCHRTRTVAQFHAGTVRPAAFEARVATPDDERSRLRRKFRDAWSRDIEFLTTLRSRPCADCDRRFDPSVMEFDHRDPTTKARLVTRLAGRVSRARLLEEIAKCDIVCANCHRVRTHARRSRLVRSAAADGAFH